MIKKKQTQKNPKPSISQRRQRCVCCLWAVWIQSCWKVNEIFRRSPLTSDCPAPLIGGCSHQSSVHVSCREPTAAFTLQSSSSLKSPKSRKPVIIVFICGQRFLRHTVLLQARTKAVRSVSACLVLYVYFLLVPVFSLPSFCSILALPHLPAASTCVLTTPPTSWFTYATSSLPFLPSDHLVLTWHASSAGMSLACLVTPDLSFTTFLWDLGRCLLAAVHFKAFSD